MVHTSQEKTKKVKATEKLKITKHGRIVKENMGQWDCAPRDITVPLRLVNEEH